MAVTAGTVVEDLDVVENISPGQLPGLVDTLADPFLFQAAEEGLCDCIVPAVATPAHAGLRVVLAAEALEVVACRTGRIQPIVATPG